MIVVTGAAGFLGSHLVQKLRANDEHVIPLYRGEECRITEKQWQAELTCKNHINKLKLDSPVPDTIIHLAGFVNIEFLLSHHNSSIPLIPNNRHITDLYTANVISTANILEFCLEKGVKHLIFASSQTVYGIPNKKVLYEHSMYNPLEHYAASKMCAEQLLQVGSRQGVTVTCLRFPGLYGEKRKTGIVYHFCKSAKNKKKIEVVTQLPLPLDVIHIDDVVAGIMSTVKYRGDGWNCFNISTAEPCNVNILADRIAALIPGCTVEHTQQWQPVVQMDVTKAEEILKWKAKPSRDRLKSMVESI